MYNLKNSSTQTDFVISGHVVSKQNKVADYENQLEWLAEPSFSSDPPDRGSEPWAPPNSLVQTNPSSSLLNMGGLNLEYSVSITDSPALEIFNADDFLLDHFACISGLRFFSHEAANFLCYTLPFDGFCGHRVFAALVQNDYRYLSGKTLPEGPVK